MREAAAGWSRHSPSSGVSVRLLCLMGSLFVLCATARAQEAPPSMLHQGARVRAEVPSFGAGWQLGSFAFARVRGQRCLGVGILGRDPTGAPQLVLLKGIRRLEVDGRTNTDAYVIGLAPPGDSDWAAVDLDSLRREDHDCPIQGKPQ